jgi:hypothetical protein
VPRKADDRLPRVPRGADDLPRVPRSTDDFHPKVHVIVSVAEAGYLFK